MPQYLTDEQVNIGSGYGLVSSGNKPLSEPVLPKSLMAYGITRPPWVSQNLWDAICRI